MGDKERARAARQGRRRAGPAGQPRASRRATWPGIEAAAERGRLPAAGQGLGRRRRHRHAPGRRPGGSAPRSSRRPRAWPARAFGDGTIYLERLRDEGAPCRDPGVRLRRRPRRASVRARMLDPAPLPEDHRGEPRRPASPTRPRARDGRGRRGAGQRRSAIAAPAPSSSSSMPTPASSTSSR